MNYTLDTKRLADCRERLGITKMEAAKRVGISQPAYLRYEAGERTPSMQVIEKIAEVFGTSAGFLTDATDSSQAVEYIIKESDNPALFEVVKKCSRFDEKQLARLLAYAEKM